MFIPPTKLICVPDPYFPPIIEYQPPNPFPPSIIVSLKGRLAVKIYDFCEDMWRSHGLYAWDELAALKISQSRLLRDSWFYIDQRIWLMITAKLRSSEIRCSQESMMDIYLNLVKSHQQQKWIRSVSQTPSISCCMTFSVTYKYTDTGQWFTLAWITTSKFTIQLTIECCSMPS